MWRSVAIGVVLGGVLAGCSWGGGSGAASEPGSQVRTTGVIVTVGGPAPGAPKPIADARIRFVGARESTTVQADHSGRFAFDAAPGRYKVELFGNAPTHNGTFFETDPDAIEVAWGAKPLALVVSIK